MNIEFYESVAKRDNHFPAEVNKIISQACNNENLKKKTIHYREWLKEHPNATVPEKSKQKVNHFTAVQFAGTFSGTGKSEDIKEMSGMIIMDFDHIDINKLRPALEEEPYTHLLFMSPSADGLKVIVRHDLTDPTKWQYLFSELEQHFKEKFNLMADTSGKDICRMCFIPFIDNLFRREYSKVWEYRGKYENPVEETEIRTATEITDEQYEEIFYLGRFLGENKINMCESYENWLKFGFSLASIGEQGRDIYHYISKASKKYNYKECNEKYTDLLDRYDPEKRLDINTFLFGARLAIGRYVIYKSYDKRIQ